jgi:hypothetical protein
VSGGRGPFPNRNRRSCLCSESTGGDSLWKYNQCEAKYGLLGSVAARLKNECHEVHPPTLDSAICYSVARSDCPCHSRPGPVTVWLGMPKHTVLEKLSSAGYKVEYRDSGSWTGPLPDGKHLIVTNRTPFPIEESWRNVYHVGFTAGRLSYAERSWFDEKDPLASVTEAMGALTEQHSRSCSVTYSPVSDPGMHASRVFIECGKRSVSLIRGEYQDSGSEHPWFAVNEYIGSPPR